MGQEWNVIYSITIYEILSVRMIIAFYFIYNNKEKKNPIERVIHPPPRTSKHQTVKLK